MEMRHSDEGPDADVTPTLRVGRVLPREPNSQERSRHPVDVTHAASAGGITRKPTASARKEPVPVVVRVRYLRLARYLNR